MVLTTKATFSFLVVAVFTFTFGAAVDVAEFVAAGAVEPPELVDELLVSVGPDVVVIVIVSLELPATAAATGFAVGVEDAVTVFVVAPAGEDTTLVGLRGLIGLTGLDTLVGFVIDFTHVFAVVIQFPDQT